MIRSLAVSAAVVSLATVSLVACQPSGEAANTAGEASLPSGDAMPATYDWHFVAHGGTGELDFGDGDWAEGVSVFTLSCRPETKSVEMSWGFEEEAVLTSGTATGTFRPGGSAPTDHPVIGALKDSGTINVGLSQADMRLVGKDAGKADLAAFFDYCDTGKHPVYSAEAAIVEDEARAAIAAEVAAQTEPAAPTAPVETPPEDPAPVSETPGT